MKKIPRAIITLVLSAISYQLSAISCYAQTVNYVRVAIVQDAVSLNLQISGPYEIIDSFNQNVLSSGRDLKTTVLVYKDGILIQDMNFNVDKVFIKAVNPEVILVDNRRFRGYIQLLRKDNFHLSVINYIELEDYIKGVLYHEISHHWPMEVIKAQAIVSRTYALYQIKKNATGDYDVTGDVYSQVYGGSLAERYRTNRAVEDTRGYVLTYNGEIFPTYYHATCSGRTEDASLLWDIDITPLKGAACNFCKDSPHFRWHMVLSFDEIKEKLKGAGFVELGSIKDIVILGRDVSGRVTDLVISTDKKDIRISAKDFRNSLGPNIIRSTNFNLKIVKGDVVFEGFGWGHGVGLCQWGAYFMARQGYKYDRILKYYYPGADLIKLK